MGKTFFSKERAERFAKQLAAQGIEDVRIWSGKDGFGQTTHTVKWNA